MRAASLAGLSVVSLLTGLTACTGERAGELEETAVTARSVPGSCQIIFGGEVCTWGTMVGDQITEFGATMPMATVQNAPAEAEMAFPPVSVGVVPLPEAVQAATGFNHLGVNWEPHGHPPGPFMVPHFDLHFYTVDPEIVEAIDCEDVTKPAMVPAGYTLPDVEIPELGTLVGLCVPRMGMHAILEAEVDGTEPFGASLIVGYDRQQVIFAEPMIAQSMLLEARTFTLEMPAAAAGPDVRWPRSFQAVYDEAAQSYRLVFSELASN